MNGAHKFESASAIDRVITSLTSESKTDEGVGEDKFSSELKIYPGNLGSNPSLLSTSWLSLHPIATHWVGIEL